MWRCASWSACWGLRRAAWARADSEEISNRQGAEERQTPGASSSVYGGDGLVLFDGQALAALAQHVDERLRLLQLRVLGVQDGCGRGLARLRDVTARCVAGGAREHQALVEVAPRRAGLGVLLALRAALV